MADILSMWSYQIKDYLGVVTTHNIWVKCPDTTTLADLDGQSVAYQQKLDHVTGGQITKVTLNIAGSLDAGNKADPVEGAECEKTMLTNWDQASTDYRYAIDVPAVSEDLIVNGKIDLANVDFEAWRLWIISLHGALSVVSKFAFALNSLIDVLISFRKHRKAETRRSLVTP